MEKEGGRIQKLEEEEYAKEEVNTKRERSKNYKKKKEALEKGKGRIRKGRKN